MVNAMKLICDLSKKTWIKTEEDFDFPEIKIGFTDNEKLPVIFDNLSFGVSIYLNNKEIKSFVYPEKNKISYKSTDLELMPTDIILPDLKCDVSYRLHAWAKNAGEIISQDFELLIPIPPSNHPDAVWNEEKNIWELPKPYPEEAPEEGFYWSWDGETKDWTQQEIPESLR